MTRRILAAILLAIGVVWVGDFLSLQYRIPNHREQFGTVQVRTYYAVELKNHRTQFLFNPPAPESCVNSLFPHFGQSPCWYLTRHTSRRIDVKPESAPL